MANFLHHTSCPKCGSKDNRAIYSDGSSWCFGCRSYTNATIFEPSSIAKIKRSYTNVTLPEDVTHVLPEPVKEWLNKWNLNELELSQLKCLYSDSKSLLIFPVYGAFKELLMYQGRYFGDNPDHPKYLTFGAKNVLHVLHHWDKGTPSFDPTVVCVEDLISAVKIGSVTNALPLWGASIPLELARRLSKRFSRLCIWLDMDKAKESLKSRSTLSMMFDEVQSIVTEKDPKEYSHDEIRRFLV